MHFHKLESCQHLESLTICTDSEESISHWESLRSLPSLRKLSIAVYRNSNPKNFFAGISQLTQLTHLKLYPHQGKIEVEISEAICDLADNNAKIVVEQVESIRIGLISVLPQLTTLLISDGLTVKDATCLSSFSSLTELQLPAATSNFPCLPHLRVLHVSKHHNPNLISILERYKDQLEQVFYNDVIGAADKRTDEALNLLKQMKKLTSLKLNSFCTNDNVSVASYFRRNLPATVQIETDDSMESDT